MPEDLFQGFFISFAWGPTLFLANRVGLREIVEASEIRELVLSWRPLVQAFLEKQLSLPRVWRE
jgi:hypothetical protein